MWSGVSGNFTTSFPQSIFKQIRLILTLKGKEGDVSCIKGRRWVKFHSFQRKKIWKKNKKILRNYLISYLRD
jgi:hypothetical protein